MLCIIPDPIIACDDAHIEQIIAALLAMEGGGEGGRQGRSNLLPPLCDIRWHNVVTREWGQLETEEGEDEDMHAEARVRRVLPMSCLDAFRSRMRIDPLR